MTGSRRTSISQADLFELRRLSELLRVALNDLMDDLAEGSREESGPLKLNLVAINSTRFDFVITRAEASEPACAETRVRLDYQRLIYKLLDPSAGATLPDARSRKLLKRAYRQVYFHLLGDLSAELRRAAGERSAMAARCIEDADVAGQARDWARGIYHLSRLRLCGLLLALGLPKGALKLSRNSVGFLETAVRPR